jgi:hypothetical protein
MAILIENISSLVNLRTVNKFLRGKELANLTELKILSVFRKWITY